MHPPLRSPSLTLALQLALAHRRRLGQRPHLRSRRGRETKPRVVYVYGAEHRQPRQL